MSRPSGAGWFGAIDALKGPDRVDDLGVRFGEVCGDLLEGLRCRAAVTDWASMLCCRQGAVHTHGGRERLADRGGGWGWHHVPR